ncbi:response regulator [Chitinimonas arctica]|uniref:response regulator n=1 Tax=Chitinimonas arctica TaxID=2594795 RepID=UPI0027E46981|nr:response regulator [Chitinimonas arctica]
MAHALIVEDDRDSAEMMAALIASEGFTCTAAHTLHDARRQLATDDPDIVLLDLMLPDGSGMELFEDTNLLANTEVVLITGHASLESSIQALRLGAADYLIKPINIKQIQGILSRVTRPATLRAEIDDLKAELDSQGRFGLLWDVRRPCCVSTNRLPGWPVRWSRRLSWAKAVLARRWWPRPSTS